MRVETHLAIDSNLCGVVTAISAGTATVELTLTQSMAVDQFGLIHGGFIFGAADFAAMVAVNHPNVVLGAAEVRFTKPSKVGETITFTALIKESTGQRRRVEVAGFNGSHVQIFSGVFSCFVPEKHVLPPFS